MAVSESAGLSGSRSSGNASCRLLLSGSRTAANLTAGKRAALRAGLPCRVSPTRTTLRPRSLTEGEVAQVFEPFGGSAGRRGKGLTANDLLENQGWRRGECIPLDDLPI